MEQIPQNNTSTLQSDIPFSDSFYRSVAMDGPALIAVVAGNDFTLKFVNNTFSRYLGYSNKDINEKQMSFCDLADPYMTDRLRYQVGTVNEDINASAKYVIYQLNGKNQQKFTCYLYISPLAADGNEIKEDTYQFVMHPDLSKWNMPFSSFNSRELFLEQFNGEDFGTFEWIIDVDKVFWSAGVYRIYEVEESEMQIDNLFAREFAHPEDVARITEVMKNALLSGEDINLEYRIITAKNKTKIIHSMARILKNKAGRAVKLAGSIRDITNQRQIEEDLKNKVDELNHSNRELEEFAYVASHDMQEPLRKITTFSDRLAEKYKDVLVGDGAMYLSRMMTSAENMRTLINDLLDFSRVSKTDQPFEPVHLNVVLRMAKTELELKIEETCTVIQSTPLPVIDAISSQMKQLFVNIISNAIKFHKEGVLPEIRISSTELTAAELKNYELPSQNTYYKIQFSDNGIGFEPEYAHRIFQVFQRLHGKSEYPGTGIGLAICKKIVEHHSGLIFAEGSPGTGAKFTFILPKSQKGKQP